VLIQYSRLIEDNLLILDKAQLTRVKKSIEAAINSSKKNTPEHLQKLIIEVLFQQLNKILKEL
jgi:hypothetical protein